MNDVKLLIHGREDSLTDLGFKKTVETILHWKKVSKDGKEYNTIDELCWNLIEHYVIADEMYWMVGKFTMELNEYFE